MILFITSSGVGSEIYDILEQNLPPHEFEAIEEIGSIVIRRNTLESRQAGKGNSD